MFYKYILSALGRLAIGPALPLPPSNHTPIPWLHPLHVAHIYTTSKQSTDTLSSMATRFLGEIGRLSQWSQSLHPKDTELSFVTAQTEESANGNA